MDGVEGFEEGRSKESVSINLSRVFMTRFILSHYVFIIYKKISFFTLSTLPSNRFLFYALLALFGALDFGEFPVGEVLLFIHLQVIICQGHIFFCMPDFVSF
jgi:hypothetical protein